jgi:hypothetical protein
MKNNILLSLLGGIICLTQLTSCEKDSRDTEYGISENQLNMINKSLAIGSGGKLYDGQMPRATGGTVAITDNPEAVQVSAGVLLYFNYNTNSNATLCKLYLQIEGSDSYWAAPIEADPVTLIPYVRILIPNFVRDGDYTITFAVEDCSGNISNLVNTDLLVTAPLGCGASFSGSVGITALVANLGSTSGVATINYEMYSIKDRIDIRYNGQWIGSSGTLLTPTGYPNCGLSPDGFVSGNGVVQFNYSASNPIVEIYVSGCQSGTAWDIDIQCP